MFLPLGGLPHEESPWVPDHALNHFLRFPPHLVLANHLAKLPVMTLTPEQARRRDNRPGAALLRLHSRSGS